MPGVMHAPLVHTSPTPHWLLQWQLGKGPKSTVHAPFEHTVPWGQSQLVAQPPVSSTQWPKSPRCISQVSPKPHWHVPPHRLGGLGEKSMMYTHSCAAMSH